MEMSPQSSARPDEASIKIDPPVSHRRAHARVRVELEVSVQSDHNFYAGITENLSAGGIFVATHHRFTEGQRVEFAVRFPGHDEPVAGVGIVRWARSYSETSDAPPGVGVEFVELGESSRRLVEEFVAARSPILWEE